MQEPGKTLKQLKDEAKNMGYGVRKWAALAGLPWQIVYRRLGNEDSIRLAEYKKLAAAVDRIREEYHCKHRKAQKCT